MKTKTKKQIKLSRKIAVTRSQQISVTVTAVTFQINQTFKLVREIKEKFGAKILPRHGFGYIGQNALKSDIAVWCVNIDKNPYWINQRIDNGQTLLERKLKPETPEMFLNRIRKDLDYNATQLRLTFARINNVFKFIGVFQLSAIDVDNQTAIYKKKDVSILSISVKATSELTVTIKESTCIH